MQAVVLFIGKYWKQILFAFAALLVYRKLRTAMNVNYVTTIYDDTGSILTKAQAKALAERLYLAMESFGTDEETIHIVRSKLTRAQDLRSVYNEFGVRDYGYYGSPWWGSASTPTDLVGWLGNELSGKDFAVWRQMFESAGIA